MGIQYVTVKVDTSGLYQPLSSAVGVVGIAGPAPSAGAGFSNPTLFTRPLVGASSEPYASVVPVLKVSALASALQTLSVSGGPTGGSFTLSFGGQTERGDRIQRHRGAGADGAAGDADNRRGGASPARAARCRGRPCRSSSLVRWRSARSR